ncbi:10-epi-juneol synthase-like [Rutidosis leptorrhynchoides]|uniref:10-epi-juneol synthase-like n=1 Tax=Rutidosis leptorrhynchoides TaxID=125765 RepID=UPI003A99908E
MTILESNSTTKVNINSATQPIRPLANFLPSIWGDCFLSFHIDDLEHKAYAKAIEMPKEELGRLIIDKSMDANEKLSLINSVHRLGLTYLFREEIEGQLDKLFKELDMKDYDVTDLYTISVNFQVFRQFGDNLSCDVFSKFKDDHSSHKFKEYIMDDVKGMLSFYESTQLRTTNECILDEALVFTQTQLMSVVDRLEGNLATKVKHALMSPFHKGMQLVEARYYFSNYKEECSRYDSLRKLANAHFNYLQLMQKEELRIMTKWSKDIEFHIITPYARDRIPDLYLWGLGMYDEPHYSQARIITSKMAQLICLLDDTYDAYATFEEIEALTNAINRWELSAMEELPEYIKPFYKVILNEHTQLEIQLSKIGKANIVNASKRAFQELATGYLKEAEWSHNRRIPSFQEYLKNGIVTSTYNVFRKSCLMGMADIVTEEALAWYDSHPKIFEATGLLGRLYNDVSSFQFERKRAQKQVTSIDAYMKTFGVPENIAVLELKKIIDDQWRIINEEYLKITEVSTQLLAPIMNLARMTDVVYRYNDRFTFPENTIEEYINLLFIAPISM